jgi:hypothetical protein
MNKCSRVGCENQATAMVIWRNPKLHSVDKTKTWGTCEVHSDYFVSYLTIRGFFLELRGLA